VNLFCRFTACLIWVGYVIKLPDTRFEVITGTCSASAQFEAPHYKGSIISVSSLPPWFNLSLQYKDL